LTDSLCISSIDHGNVCLDVQRPSSQAKAAIQRLPGYLPLLPCFPAFRTYRTETTDRAFETKETAPAARSFGLVSVKRVDVRARAGLDRSRTVGPWIATGLRRPGDYLPSQPPTADRGGGGILCCSTVASRSHSSNSHLNLRFAARQQVRSSARQ
jgi:hypothetical protein